MAIDRLVAHRTGTTEDVVIRIEDLIVLRFRKDP